VAVFACGLIARPSRPLLLAFVLLGLIVYLSDCACATTYPYLQSRRKLLPIPNLEIV
jgi:hypothetical protein